MTTAAAWVVAASLWVGALTPGPWWLAPLGLAVLIAARMADGGGSERRRRNLAVVAVALTLVGSGLAGGRAALRDGGLLPALAASGGAAEMAATVVTDPRPTEPAPWQAADAEPGWLLVRVSRLDGRRLRERALVRVDDVEDAPALGERLRLTATARPVEEDGFGGYLRRRHAAVALDPQTLEVIAPPGPALAATNRVRQRTPATSTPSTRGCSPGSS